MKSPADSPDLPGRSPPDQAPKLRLLTLGHLDGRTLAAKRAKELIEAIETDLGGGDRLSGGERQLVQRAAVLGALRGEVAQRVLVTIGLERRARDVVPSVAEYVERVREKGAATRHELTTNGKLALASKPNRALAD
jgi:hypothetical protein